MLIRILCVGVLLIGLSGCRKTENATAKEFENSSETNRDIQQAVNRLKENKKDPANLSRQEAIDLIAVDRKPNVE